MTGLHKPGRGKASPSAALAVTLLALACLTGASPSPYGSAATVDWPRGVLVVEASLDLYAAGIRLPSGRSEAERLLDGAAPDMAMQAALSINLDSYRTVGDALGDGSLDPGDMRRYLEGYRRVSLNLSVDSGRLLASYEWSLPALSALFVRHSVPVTQRAVDRYAPTRAYSGIVVYAKGGYPLRGEHRQGTMSPCLYPRIYDLDMETVLERNLMDPAALRAWGSVGYAFSLDDPAVERRAGSDPLRVIPTEVFGSRRTDAVISREDALRILASPENRELIRQGRVVFVIDPPPAK